MKDIITRLLEILIFAAFLSQSALYAVDFPELPSGPPGPGRFGASYANLKYSPDWDAPWRVGDHPDVVVRFDDGGHRLVFWRGTSYIPCWVSDAGVWYTNEFVERRGHHSPNTEGCVEPMSDKQCRYSHVRIIESHDARVVVHWRYAPVDVMYEHPFIDPNTGWFDWVDEYYTIYPDAVGVRKITVHTNQPDLWMEFHEAIVVNQPGTKPQDNGDYQLITVVGMDGETERWTWENKRNGERLDPEIADPVIEYMNLKSNYKHFVIGEVGSRWRPLRGYGALKGYSNMNCWNHWPVAFLPSDGRVAPTSDRPSSTCVGTMWPVRHNISEHLQIVKDLYGLTDKPPSELAALARSWNSAPEIADASGFSDYRYDQSQRAYVVTADAKTMSFSLSATDKSPVLNPCIVIKNWGSHASATLKIDGKEQADGSHFRQGIIRDTDGTLTMVIWLEFESTKATNFVLSIG